MTLKIPFRFSIAEYADTLSVYSVGGGKAVHAVPEYQRHFPNRKMPTRRENGTFSNVRFTAELEVNQYVDKQKELFRWIIVYGDE
jgi:hypothetical protein